MPPRGCSEARPRRNGSVSLAEYPKPVVKIERERNGRLDREGGPAGLYGLAEGLRVGVGQVSLGMGAPQPAGELVELGAGSGGGGNGGVKLSGRHGSPFPKTRLGGTAQAKHQRCPSTRDLRRNQFSGSIGINEILIRSRRCRDMPARLIGGSSCF